MTVSEFLTHVNLALRGTDDDAPTFGTDEANYWVATLNRKKDELYRNSRVLWDATWSVDSLGVVTASATPTYNCETELIAPSDKAFIVDTNSQKVYYDLIKPRERKDNKREVYLAGVNPQILYFTNEIEAGEDIVGGTLYLPGYYMPADVSLEDDDLPLPDPYWGVMAVAAEVAFNDIVYEDKAEGLNAKANALYMQMVRNNRRGTYNNPRVTSHNHYRIRSAEIN
jgi:hypothetical protein